MEPSEGFVEPGKQVDTKVTMKAVLEDGANLDSRLGRCNARMRKKTWRSIRPDSWAPLKAVALDSAISSNVKQQFQ